MTSSPADEEIEEKPKKVPGWRQPWDTWRIMMMAGSIVLLGLAFSQVGGRTRLPEWGMAAVYAIGYGLLAYGFFLAMRTRKGLKAKREAKAKEKKVSPRDPR